MAHHITGRYALDLHPEDVFWCTADPGWVTGTSYGIIAPLTNRTTMIVDEAEFDVERWYGIIQDHKVNVFYTAPTAIRMLMRAGAEVARQFDLSSLRFLASVGEPRLHPDGSISVLLPSSCPLEVTSSHPPQTPATARRRRAPVRRAWPRPPEPPHRQAVCC